MKVNQEAYQIGSETGWDDGYRDLPPETKFNFPDNYSEEEKQFFLSGYDDGYKQGQRDS